VPGPAGAAAVLEEDGGPIIIHADLVWTEEHLKALGVAVERTPGRTTILRRGDRAKVVEAMTKVLQVLRMRMAVHEQNLRNAERIRDAENRINPYRRKVLKIGPQGAPVEELDPAPFRKVQKPGDPNADADGFVTMPNVDRAAETAELQAAVDEYRLVRACMERLAPLQIFPDPAPLPARTEGQ
jgi:flagellar basal-body rod protein FlgC